MAFRYPVTWQEFYRNSQALAWRLNTGKKWDGMIVITRGGLVPAAIMARELNIRKIETISIVSYSDDDKQIEPEIIKPCQVENGGKNWLVVDDLVDTGRTTQIVRDMLPNAHIATIYAKPHGKDLVDTFMTEVSQDTWIVFPWEEET